MLKSRVKATAELLKKALHIWAVQYHFRIPMKMLKMYIHKFLHESSNISKYANRFFDPDNPEEYRQWLALQPKPERVKKLKDIVRITEKETLDLRNTDCEYVCIMSDGCNLYPWFGDIFRADADIIYFDHDSKDEDGQRINPVLKPDFSYNTLRSFNYIGRCFAVKTSLLKQFEGKPWNPYEWLLKLSDQTDDFVHVSHVAYYDMNDQFCEVDTLMKYLEDAGEKAEVRVNPDGISCTVTYELKEEPLISILIPTRNGKDLLKVCVDSVYRLSTYRNFEIIIADNRSSEPETLEYLEQLEQEHDNCHIVKVDTDFNFSKINNIAAESAKGEYLVLLNNDTEVITPDWLEKMLGYAQRDNVGSVGAMLYYEDNTIQHAGIILGKGGDAGHRWYQCPKDQKSYLYTLEAPNDVACCTAACLMTSRKLWDELKGFNEELTVQYNDVDYGLRMLKNGYCNVFLPDVKLYHYESKSRGIDKTKEAVDRYFAEMEWVKEHYSEYIAHDPFYNDSFDKNYDYKLIAGTGSN